MSLTGWRATRTWKANRKGQLVAKVLVMEPDGYAKVFGGNRATLKYLVLYWDEKWGRWFIWGFRSKPVGSVYTWPAENILVEEE